MDMQLTNLTRTWIAPPLLGGDELELEHSIPTIEVNSELKYSLGSNPFTNCGYVKDVSLRVVALAGCGSGLSAASAAKDGALTAAHLTDTCCMQCVEFE
ncbi:hypothetical protein EGR_03290 [Echinococcus granulosus]|uniref:Uncharacterized protein n=1 Tax=Echinococcus granulosus TaxID=6210 RepID=W6V5V2_ECHGR|nr:hypothetical protein EGR_03290 [Echinococcus granulosus]EUB61744.1 hypothetical protein EGR_03290 [Echinococcus granulosus]